MTATYRDLIHVRAEQLINHPEFGGELSSKEQKFTGVLLNIIANDFITTVDYPPTDEIRATVAHRLADLAWNYGALFQTLGKTADDMFRGSIERAIAIVKEV
jgi:hypothetical protein